MTAAGSAQLDGGFEVSRRGVGLAVRDLRVETTAGSAVVVDEIAFDVAPGEVFGLVGESGSGKTTIGLALLGHTRRGLRITGGEVLLNGRSVFAASPRELRSLRGSEIAYVPQDPASALHPLRRVRTQVSAGLRAHRSGSDVDSRVAEVLDEVGLPSDREMLRRLPHELSGGQQQRVALAMAFVCRPSVIVLDEPTTGLDVTIQRRVLETVRTLCSAYGVAAVYVSHDLAVIANLASSVAVLYAGRVVEYGPSKLVFSSPVHPYTRGLLESVPLADRRKTLHGIPGRVPRPGQRPRGCAFAPRCVARTESCLASPPASCQVGTRLVRCIHAEELLHQHSASHPGSATTTSTAGRADGSPGRGSLAAELAAPADPQEGPQAESASAPAPQDQPRLTIRRLTASYGEVQVLAEVDLSLARNESIAVVGESGAGKTTLAQCIVGLHTRWSGEIDLDGLALSKQATRRDRESLRKIQYIFQNPYLSLNPRKTILETITAPMQHFFSWSGAEALERAAEALRSVSLEPDNLYRYPDQLSGGERQRVAIARALAAQPTVLVCDEITSALDVSVQAAIVELLVRLRQEQQLSLVFITHNLALVRNVAEVCVVLSAGRIVEAGRVEDVLERPTDPYTAELVANIPSLFREGVGAR